MRGRLGPILVGLGGFLIVTALLCQFWAYPKLAVAPIDQDSVTTLEADGATVFSTSTLSEETTDLLITARTVADMEASKNASDDEGKEIRIYITSSSTRDGDGNIRSRSISRSAFDAYSGEAINCCDEYEENEEGNRESVEHAGLVVKFPFRTEKKDYDFWDSTLGETVPAEYVGEEEVEGINTYKFEQVIEPTEVGTIDLPAELLGEDGDETLTADRMYSNTRTFWVEPITGAVLNRNEKQLSTLQYDGTDRVTLTEADVSYTQDSIEETADTVRTKAVLLNLLSPILPIVFLIVGVLCVIGGVLLARRRETPGDADDSADTTPRQPAGV